MGGGKTKSLPRKDKAHTDKAQTRMTPHLAPNHESSRDLQDLQSITAAASISTSAALSIANIADIATIAGAATTAPIVGEVGVADTVVNESANKDHGDGKVGDADSVEGEYPKEDYGDGEVGNADPADNKFATENHGDGKVGINLSNTYNWIIEGVEGFYEERVRHMNAFYALLRKWGRGKEYTSQLITKEDYNARVNFLLRVNEGNTD